MLELFGDVNAKKAAACRRNTAYTFGSIAVIVGAPLAAL